MTIARRMHDYQAAGGSNRIRVPYLPVQRVACFFKPWRMTLWSKSWDEA